MSVQKAVKLLTAVNVSFRPRTLKFPTWALHAALQAAYEEARPDDTPIELRP